MTVIFDGNLAAERKRQMLAAEVAGWTGKKIRIAAIVFREDEGGQLYTRKKAAAAEEVGMEYEPCFFSARDSVEIVRKKIEELNHDPRVTGIIIQKPTRKVYETAAKENDDGVAVGTDFQDWWRSLTAALVKEKDVDGLSPETLTAVEAGTWREEGRVLPATVRAVLGIMKEIGSGPDQGKMVIIGKSDLLGRPLFGEVRRLGYTAKLIGRKGLAGKMENGQSLKEYKLIVSATGQAGLIKGEMIADEGVVLIDVGEPSGDVDEASVMGKAAWLTPVPGGVGPLTVVSLLENALFLARNY